MNFQLTTFGTALLNADTGPITITSFKLGSAYNYIPLPTDTDIRGSLEYEGVPTPPFNANPNIIKYSCYLGYEIGDFDFGEVGLFVGTDLFALGASSVLIHKIQSAALTGNSIRIDAYLSIVGTNYEMWFDLAESNNQFRVATLHSPAQLPPSYQATPNVYIIEGHNSTQSPMMAYTDRLGLWNFDTYQFTPVATATIIGFDNFSVTINIADYNIGMNPDYLGQIILEFITGSLYSICRYVETIIQSGNNFTFSFDTSVATTPVVGDRFQVFRRVPASTDLPVLPIATPTVLGGIKIGTGLLVAPDGTCSVDPHSLGTVTSVNGEVGDVIVNAANLPGLATVGITGDYNSLINKPPAFVLPIMGVALRGGARLPSNGNLVITGTDVLDLGFAPVKTVANIAPDVSGNISLGELIIGLVDPTAVPAGANLNTYATTGLFTVSAAATFTIVNAPPGNLPATLEVVPIDPSGTGDTIQRWTNENTIFWRKLTGALWTSWKQTATNAVATTSSLGVVQIGAGLAVTVGGILSTNVASATVLGAVKIGSGISVDVNGVISVSTSLPIATTSILGGIIVGAGLAITGGGVLSATATAVPIATTSSLGTVQIGSGLSITGGGILSASSVALATVSAPGIMQVGAGLAVSAGVVSATVQTVNGVSPIGGNVTVPSDASKLNRVSGVATGILLTFNNVGTISSGSPVTFTLTNGNVQAATFTGGTTTWTLNGWPASGTYGEIQLEVINGGLSTHTFPGTVNWVQPDGSFTTSFSAYMTAQRGTGFTNFQTSGTDFVCMWTRNGGATIYAKVM